MKLRTRRIIALIFITAFFITAPILILYTAGYRYNFTKNQLKKTGALFVETEPKGATVFIDDEQRKESTPAHITNVFPNHYKIRIEKEDYFTWEKELEIKAQNTTFAEDVVLFKKTQPEKIKSDLNIEQICEADDYIISQTKENKQTEFFCFDLKEEKFESIADIIYPDSKIIDISANKNKFIITNSPNTYQIQSTDKSYSQTISNLPINPIQIKWDEENEHFIYLASENQIWQANLLGSEPKYSQIYTTTSQKIYDFAALGEKLYFIIENEQGIFLNLTSIQNPTKIDQSIQLPSSNFVIDSFIDNYLILVDKSRSNIYVLYQDLSETKINLDGSDKYAFFEKNDLMAIYNGFEIFIVNLKDELPQPNLIIRHSSPYEKVAWFNDNYLIALHENKIKIIELDDREKHNIWELNTENIKIEDFFLDEDKENVYYLAENQLWKINIQ